MGLIIPLAVLAVVVVGAVTIFVVLAIGRTIMAQIDDLNAVVTQIGTDVSAVSDAVTGVQGDVTEVIALLQAVQVPGADLTDPIAKLTAAHAALGALGTTLAGVDASLKAVEPAAS